MDDKIFLDGDLTYSPDPMEEDVPEGNEWYNVNNMATKNPEQTPREAAEHERIQRNLQHLAQTKHVPAKKQSNANRLRLARELEKERDRWARCVHLHQACTEQATTTNPHQGMTQTDHDFWLKFNKVTAKVEWFNLEMDRLAHSYQQVDLGERSDRKREKKKAIGDPLDSLNDMLARVKLQTDSDAEDEWMYAIESAKPGHLNTRRPAATTGNRDNGSDDDDDDDNDNLYQQT